MTNFDKHELPLYQAAIDEYTKAFPNGAKFSISEEAYAGPRYDYCRLPDSLALVRTHGHPGMGECTHFWGIYESLRSKSSAIEGGN